MRQSWTPGRVNLIGEWVDFNGGWVLPAALPLGVTVTLQPISGDKDRVVSAQFAGVAAAAMDAPATGHWADYVFGALQIARSKGWIGGAAELTLTSDIPAGAGVSSSAAVAVGVLRAAAPVDADLTLIAKLAQHVEHQFIGVPCGIMDQMAVAHTGSGEALALDTRSMDFERVQLPDGWRFLVIHSGVERKLADGRYRTRRDACLAAAEQLKLAYLCDADDVSGLQSELRPIARHVVTENDRTFQAVPALKAGGRDRFGALMNASHVSLRDDFKVSTPAVDALVADLNASGVSGARITGAGFGGCIVALLAEGDEAGWLTDVLGQHPGAKLVCEIGSKRGEA